MSRGQRVLQTFPAGREGGPHRLGVVADTHCPEFMAEVPRRVFEILSGVEAIVHCGDVGGKGGEKVLAALGEIAPVHAVRGDHDRGLESLPAMLELRWRGFGFGVLHGHRSHLLEEPSTLISTLSLGQIRPRIATGAWLRRRFPRADVILYGHSHEARVTRFGSQVHFNPGAVYVVDAQEAAARLRRHPGWFTWTWLQVTRRRRDRPRPSIGVVELTEGKLAFKVVPLD